MNRTIPCLTALAVAAIAARAEAGVTNVSSCTTINKPGDYQLVQNLTRTGDCVKIQADFVTLDLGGFSIKGTGSGRALTDNGAPRKGFVVRNGTISNFQDGIDLVTGPITNVVIENLRVSDMTDAGVTAGGGSIIRGNTVAHTGSTAIMTGAGSSVSGNTITQAGGSGIIADQGSIVKDNAVTGGSAVGIIAGAGSTLTGNSVTGNATRGLSITCPSTLVENTSADNPTGCTPMVDCANLFLVGGGCTNANNTAP